MEQQRIFKEICRGEVTQKIAYMVISGWENTIIEFTKDH